ncbi:MAG: serine/threonine protein kinase [Myxococcales bacterium]|nr:serine/threonine protein kinase [Myxococcales bacterium]
MSCLAENTVFAFLAGRLPPAPAAEVLAHIDDCAHCRQFIAGAAHALHSSPVHAAPLPTARSELSRGTIVGRYIVLHPLGRGGMGVVYAAYDPELERKIALKHLHPALLGVPTDATPATKGDADVAHAPGVGQTQRLLLHEAQAMAKVRHPNVLSVHDVGVHCEQVFLAMELIEGWNLAEWLTARRPSLAEILAVFHRAGSGLLAAHRAGLIHCDFKPQNVLISEAGGVYVTDFGLARAFPAGGVASDTVVSFAEAPVGEAPRLRTEELVGTPAYMAPEQFTGAKIDARTDQFSYCVALYEAVYGERPFSGRTLDQLARAVQSGRITDGTRQSGRKVPAWLRRVLLRGLSVHPEERFPSLEELLIALQPVPRRSLRRVLTLSGAVGLALLGLGAGQMLSRRQQLVCTGMESKLHAIWDPPRREAIRAAFVAQNKPYAASVWSYLESRLSAYARDLTTMYTEACEATRLRGEQSAELLDLRIGCLEQRRRELSAVSESLTTADARLLNNVPQMLDGLGRIEECADVERLRMQVRPPADPRTRQLTEELRQRIAQIMALRSSAKYRQSLDVARETVRAASQVGHSPLQAEALYALGLAEESIGDAKAAESTLYEALWKAEEGRHDWLVVRIWGALVGSVGIRQNRFEEGLQLGRHAHAALARVGGDAKEAVLLDNKLGALHRDLGDPEGARQQHARLLALLVSREGEMSYDVALLRVQLELDLFELGRLDEALVQNRQVRAIYKELLGASHPSLGDALMRYGTNLYYAGKKQEALSAAQDTLRIYGNVHLPQSPKAVVARQLLGKVLLTLGRCAESATLLAQVARDYERSSTRLAYVQAELQADQAAALSCQKLHPQALASAERAQQILDQIKESDVAPEDLANIRYRIAQVLRAAARQPERVRALSRNVIESLKKSRLVRSPIITSMLADVKDWADGAQFTERRL